MVNPGDVYSYNATPGYVPGYVPGYINGTNFRFLIFREDCFNEFKRLNFFYQDCISITISKILGYGIILGALLVKIPQVFNIMKAKSADGLLLSMFYLEILMYMISGSYNKHLGSPFSTYGENFALLAQNIIIVFFAWKYSDHTSTSSKLLLSVGMTSMFLYLIWDNELPEYLWTSLMNLQFVMIIMSRVPQIKQNFETKSTGHLSIITFVMNAVGNMARLFTLMKETTDSMSMTTAIISFVLNMTLVVQILMLWKSTNEANLKNANKSKVKSE
jgi:mannose-P-dolichol utilization defect protein 1